MLRVRITSRYGEAFERTMDGEAFVVGRSSKAGLPLADPLLSREHARLLRSGQTWFVEDLGSQNGTFLNGARISSRSPLKEGDVLDLGATTLTFKPAEGRGGTGDPLEAAFGEQALFRSAQEIVSQVPKAPPGEEGLRRHAERLRILNDVHQALAGTATPDELLQLILDRVFDHLGPEEGAIFLKRGKDKYECPVHRSSRKNGPSLLYSRNLIREVVEKRLAALVQDVPSDIRFSKAESLMGAGLRSLLAAPLFDSEGPMGMIVLASRASVRQFMEADMELLVSLASVASLRIRNLALAEEAAERRRLEDELALARRIQTALLPSQLPKIAGWDIHGGALPSQTVSGDYYEVNERRGGEELVCFVADVAGKGIGASLLTASLEALCAAPLEAGQSPSQVLDRVSPLLFRRSPPEKYATVFLAIIETATGRVRYANAGHPPGIVIRAGKGSEWLGATGVPLGLLPESRYAERETVLSPGETLFLYTDGIPEAANAAGEEYGRERLMAFLSERMRETASALAVALERDLEAFAPNLSGRDDRTLVVIRRLPA